MDVAEKGMVKVGVGGVWWPSVGADGRRRTAVLGLYGKGPCGYRSNWGNATRDWGRNGNQNPMAMRSRSDFPCRQFQAIPSWMVFSTRYFRPSTSPRGKRMAALPREGHWRAAPVPGGEAAAAYATRRNSSYVGGTGASYLRSNQATRQHLLSRPYQIEQRVSISPHHMCQAQSFRPPCSSYLQTLFSRGSVTGGAQGPYLVRHSRVPITRGQARGDTFGCQCPSANDFAQQRNKKTFSPSRL